MKPRILIPVDLEDQHATASVQAASEWARRLDATVDLFYVDQHGALDDVLHDTGLREMVLRDWDAYRVRFEVQLQMLMLKIPTPNRGSIYVMRGKPPEAIVAAASDYDLIVLGTHGRTGLQRALRGSVAEAVVRKCTVPVLVTHPHPEA